MAAYDPERLIDETLSFYEQSLGWLSSHHASWAVRTVGDLSEEERDNAVWKLSGQSIAHGFALVELLRLRYTSQTWPLMRAIHEVDRLLIAVTDTEEERIPRRWLRNQEVKQSEARQAERRQRDRIAAQMAEAGLSTELAQVDEFSQQVYRGMSRAAHHRREAVDEAVDHEARTMVYGPDPRADRVLAFVIFAGALIHEVVLLAGDALAYLWGPAFYPEHLQPMLRSVEEMLAALDVIDVARDFGLLRPDEA